MSDTKRRKKLLMEADPHCTFCGCELSDEVVLPGQKPSDNTACLYHTVTRYDSSKTMPNHNPRTLLACLKCVRIKSEEKHAEQGIDALREASARGKKYWPLLNAAPPADTDLFIDYLRANNVVIYEDMQWIIIENCKYHTPEKTWYTMFSKLPVGLVNMNMMVTALEPYWDWQWLKKSRDNQTIPERFHIHLTPTK